MAEVSAVPPGAESMPLGAAVDYWADQDPDATWLVDDTGDMKRAQVMAKANQVARHLTAAGVGEGSLVTVALPNSIEFALAVLGIWKAGGTPQLVSSRLPAPERDAIVALADPPVVIGVDEGSQPGRLCLPRGWVAECEGLEGPIENRQPSSFHAPCSGGSTGRPKIIVTKRPALIDPHTPLAPGSQVLGTQLIAGPMYHNGPFLYGMSGMLTGNKLVIMPRFDAERMLALAAAHRVDWVALVPTMMHRIIRLGPAVLGRYDLSSLQTVLHFGAVCPDWLKRAWIDLVGPQRLLEIYGGAEGQAAAAISGEEWLAHPGSVGRPLTGRFRVLDDAGREVPAGQVGELFMMPDGGTGSTYRYLGAEPNNRDGWESLGDMGYIDEDGWIYLVDRRKDLIVTGGANVYPAELEGVLEAHPAVVACAVMGRPDDDLGELVHAFVEVDRPVSPSELAGWVARHLARYKVPRAITLVEEPLRDEAGKVRRAALRERFADAKTVMVAGEDDASPNVAAAAAPRPEERRASS